MISRAARLPEAWEEVYLEFFLSYPTLAPMTGEVRVG